MPALTVSRLAELCSGELRGDPHRLISGANSLEIAQPSDLSFLANPKAAAKALASQAGCLIAPLSFNHPGPWSVISVEGPRAAFALCLAALYPQTRPSPLIHSTAIVAPSAQIAAGCFIGPYVVVGDETIIAEGCQIGAGCSIGCRVSVGAQTTLHPRVTLYDGVCIGARVIVHSGSVIGADGFGFTLAGDHYEKFPQVGAVDIGDDVEIGANCCIDRAALGVTSIADGVKLDNLIHIAHNCAIGRHVVIAAQTGLSGSVTIGDYAVIGGQAGVGEKAKIASHAIVGGKAGVLTSQHVNTGEPVWGIPARPLRQHLKGLANVGKLSELRNEVRELRRKLDALETASRGTD
ncbi:MAG: UDP-3-O-(3-hydroxymyristoyl)glucosamine N-acyltransferase [Acidobacteriaceae bacterium]|nr:UDP-3-O-(3-hydroxymyristoyl)glucosamine N-acyltransferase [Acidobacteriaceae bacterium]